ncbi:RNA pyrophosphohydrolase [Gammaproteobacteria bacterium]|nr:RNA pyrophosphohydrolase [Gammaproteobacteria bacterium]
MIDEEGYRPNVGIIVMNKLGQVLWAKRLGKQGAWQFPQGGIDEGENPEDALYRELHEEVGLLSEAVKILGQTKGWLKYNLPEHMVRKNSDIGFLGQKQKWFLLELVAGDDKVILDTGSSPEFQDWKWVSYWYPVSKIVDFKQRVYRSALGELAPYVPA